MYVTNMEPTLEMPDMLEIPMFKLQETALGKKVMRPASGQHCVEAVSMWYGLQEKQLVDLLQAKKRLEGRQLEQPDLVEISVENKQNKPKEDNLEANLAFGGQWLVILYDAGKSISICLSCTMCTFQGLALLSIYLFSCMLADRVPASLQILLTNHSDCISLRMKTTTYIRKRRKRVL